MSTALSGKEQNNQGPVKVSTGNMKQGKRAEPHKLPKTVQPKIKR